MGNVTPNSCAKSREALALSWETATKLASLPPYCLKTRSRKGNVNLHTGQETLKKESATGPRCRAEPRLNSLPSIDFREKPGATFPGTILDIPSSAPSQRR